MTTIGTAPSAAALDADALSELREGFRGQILEPGDGGYDEARGVFNGMFDRKPAVILRPSGTADVIRAIGLARQSGLPFAIRSGGHSVAGFSGVDGGIVLDLRGLKGVRVDPEHRTARVQAGVDWGQFDRETQQFGLAVTGGRVTSTGVVGFTLGSGSGWLERKLGFACDNLISADVVTADGDVVVATESENADLLWGLKGGGGNFGVVTELEFRLHPVAPIVYGGLMAFDPAKGHELIKTWRDISDEGPEELGWAVASVCAPPEPFVPEQWQGKRMWAVVGQFAGPQDEAEKLFAPLRALKPEFDLFQPMPYTIMQGLIDAANPYGRRNYWRAAQHRQRQRRVDRRDARPLREDGVPVRGDAPRQPRRCDRTRRRERHRARRTCGAVCHPSEHDVGRRRERRRQHRVDEKRDGHPVALDLAGDGAELLHRGRRRRGRRQLRRAARAAATAEAHVRPGQPVPDEPEHQAELTLVAGGRQKTAAASFRLHVLESGCSWPSSLKSRTIRSRASVRSSVVGTVSTRCSRIRNASS